MTKWIRRESSNCEILCIQADVFPLAMIKSSLPSVENFNVYIRYLCHRHGGLEMFLFSVESNRHRDITRGYKWISVVEIGE